MKQSLVTLLLCCSAFSAVAQADTRMPWIDRPSNARTEPALDQARPTTLRDFNLGPASVRGTSSPWMKEATDRYRQSSPAGASKESEEANYDIQVFISTGMPEGVLRHLFAQAMDYPPGKVRFVVRGFTPQKLGQLVAKLRGLFPDPYADHISLDVDPNAFRTYRVEAVPVFLVRDKSRWFEVQGTQSLEAAQANVKKRSNKVVGELYAISEPDILAVIEERAKSYNWRPVLKRAQQRIAKNLKPGFDLPTASQDATTYFVPTFTAPHDINTPTQDGKGEIALAKAGQTFRLLDYTRLQVPVVVFDPSDARQVAMVKRWIARPEMKTADLFIVGEHASQSTEVKTPPTVELSKAFKRPVYLWQTKLSERMGVEAVPAIVEQDGDRLRVRYFDPEKR